jgi:hypothetical protein
MGMKERGAGPESRQLSYAKKKRREERWVTLTLAGPEKRIGCLGLSLIKLSFENTLSYYQI